MRIGLVLSGGGARGFAHIGVLKALEENKISISEIAGCSMGALIGAFYASGKTAKEIEQIALKIKPPGLRDFAFSRKGLLKTGRIERELEKYLQAKTFEELKIPLSINAVDITSGKEVIFRKGNLVNAVRASFSVPAAFVPAKSKGHVLVDGGVINPLPANNIRNADFVIMVNVSTKLERLIARIGSIAKQAIALREQHMINLELQDFKLPYHIIRPDISDFKGTDFKKIGEIIPRGYAAAIVDMPSIKKKIKEKPKKSSFLSEVFRKLFRKF